MAQLKIANWNIEWMNRWFSVDTAGPPQMRSSQEISGVTDIDDLAGRVAQVIKDLGADVITVQEGPSRRSEMDLYVRDFLADAYEVQGPAGRGQQRVYALLKKGGAVIDAVWRIEEEHGIDLAGVWDADIDADLILDEYRFTRPPLVVGITTSTGREMRLVSVHTKSKYVHNGQSMWRDPARRHEFVKMAVAARRRIAAEALRIRQYLNALFEADEDAAIVVTGDFNDGPGLDFFERQYLLHNVADLIAGSPFVPQRMLRHAFVDLMPKEQNYTAEFFDFVDEVQRKVLLDHIFVSASLYWTGNTRTADGRIEHALYEAARKPSAPGSRERDPSDHRPQTVTLEV